jgi:hypothetical protein
MNRTSRTVAVSEPLWAALETMSREMGVDRDVLLNQAIFSLARQFGFITPTQVNLLERATAASAPAPAVQPVEKPREESPRVDVAEPRRDLAEDADTGGPPTVLAAAGGDASEAPDAAEPTDEKAAAQAPAVDVAALRQGVVARMRDILADVDRLVEPVDERLRAEAEDSDDEEASDDDDASSDDSDDEDDEDASDDEEASDDEDAADDEEDEARPGDAGGVAAAAAGGVPAPTPKPPAPAETTIIVSTTSGVPLHIRLDEGEPVRVARERFIIGRGAHCDLVVKSARVSREHAAVIREGAEFFIEDLTSSNGTWFDNTRITRRLVSDGEEYLLGGIRVTFTLG